MKRDSKSEEGCLLSEAAYSRIPTGYHLPIGSLMTKRLNAFAPHTDGGLATKERGYIRVVGVYANGSVNLCKPLT